MGVFSGDNSLPTSALNRPRPNDGQIPDASQNWTNVNNITQDDNATANAYSPSGSFTTVYNYLTGAGYSFPNDMLENAYPVVGIEVTIDATFDWLGDFVSDRLAIFGPSGTVIADGSFNDGDKYRSSTQVPQSPQREIRTVGSPSDDWGISGLTTNQLNGNVGAGYSIYTSVGSSSLPNNFFSADVRYIRLRIYYEADGTIKRWDSSQWTEHLVKVWDGSNWNVKPVKVWNGSSWVNA